MSCYFARPPKRQEDRVGNSFMVAIAFPKGLQTRFKQLWWSKLPTNYLSVFGHFVELVLKGLSRRRRAEHCKVFEYAVFSPPCFHVFRLNTETYKIYFKSKFPCSVQRRVNKDQQKKPRYSNIFEVVQLAQNNCQIFRTFLNINIVENITEATLEPNWTSTAEYFCENRYRVYRFTGCHS